MIHEGVDCFDCENCEILDEVYGIFNCKHYPKVWSGGASVDCEFYEERVTHDPTDGDD